MPKVFTVKHQLVPFGHTVLHAMYGTWCPHFFKLTTDDFPVLTTELPSYSSLYQTYCDGDLIFQVIDSCVGVCSDAYGVVCTGSRGKCPTSWYNLLQGVYMEATSFTLGVKGKLN